MIQRLRWLVPALLISGCAAAPAAQSAVTTPVGVSAVAMPGSYTAQSVESPEMVVAASQARDLLAGPDWLNDPNLKVLKVLSAETQVVAGTNVRMAMQVRFRNETRWCRVVLFRGLHGERSLSSVTVSPTAASQNWNALGGPHDPADKRLVKFGAEQAQAMMSQAGWLGRLGSLQATGGVLTYSWVSIGLHVDGTVVLGGKTRTFGVWMAHPIGNTGRWVLGDIELGAPR